MAVVPGAKETIAPMPRAKDALWRHALTLTARKTGEKATRETRRVGLECFQDDNAGTILYISEEGAIAVVPQ